MFYATFIPGLQNVIAQVIKERLPDVKILRLLENAVLFETKISYDRLNFFCFNNIFMAINVMEHGNKDESAALEKHINAVLKDSVRQPVWVLPETGGLQDKNSNLRETQNIIANNNKKFKTFRIIASCENKPAAINEKLRCGIEKYISQHSGLKTERRGGGAEFWFLYYKVDNDLQERDFTIFMKRLTLHQSWEKSIHKGELPPPLSWILCYLAKLKHDDTVLDPFCGYGSIPQAALKYFPCKKFIACDNDHKTSEYTLKKFKDVKEYRFFFYENDFLNLLSIIPEKSIDVIITDPPWGDYKKIDDNNFLGNIIKVFNKLLKESGRVVLLFNNLNNDNLIKELSIKYNLQEKIPILLSGKKAVIFLFAAL